MWNTWITVVDAVLKGYFAAGEMWTTYAHHPHSRGADEFTSRLSAFHPQRGPQLYPQEVSSAAFSCKLWTFHPQRGPQPRPQSVDGLIHNLASLSTQCWYLSTIFQGSVLPILQSAGYSTTRRFAIFIRGKMTCAHRRCSLPRSYDFSGSFFSELSRSSVLMKSRKIDIDSSVTSASGSSLIGS